MADPYFEIDGTSISTSATSLKVDHIAEKTAAHGVAIDGITLKDDLDTSGIVGKTEAQTLTNKTLTSPLFTGTIDGWISTGTFTYASANTITVASGAASIYQKGDKIKLTQTTVKYFYITTVADTLLTVTGGTDYTVANAAITLPYYSHTENPLGFPDWFNVTAPTFDVTTYDNGSAGQPTTVRNKMKICGKMCLVRYVGSGVKVTTNSLISFDQSVYPTIVSDANGVVGAGTYHDGVQWRIPAIVWRDSTHVDLNNDANIADNAVISSLSYFLYYEF